MTTATMNNFSIINEEGYMGSHGFVGSNNKAWNFSNLSQVIRKALRDNLAVTKKSNINVKKHCYEISREDFFNASKEEKSKIIDRFFEWVSLNYMNIGEKHEIQHLPKFCLTDEALQLIEMAKKIVLSFNSDHSNSMVDYFDRDFYETIYIQWV